MKKEDLDRLIGWLEQGEYGYKYHGKRMSESMQTVYAQYIKEDFYSELLSDDYDTAEKVLNQIDDSYESRDLGSMFANGIDDE